MVVMNRLLTALLVICLLVSASPGCKKKTGGEDPYKKDKKPDVAAPAAPAPDARDKDGTAQDAGDMDIVTFEPYTFDKVGDFMDAVCRDLETDPASHMLRSVSMYFQARFSGTDEEMESAGLSLDQVVKETQQFYSKLYQEKKDEFNENYDVKCTHGKPESVKCGTMIKKLADMPELNVPLNQLKALSATLQLKDCYSVTLDVSSGADEVRKEMFYVGREKGLWKMLASPSQIRETYKQRNERYFLACLQMLKHLQIGLITEAKEVGSLSHVRGVDDVCHQLMEGMASADDCRGAAAPQLESVCMPGSFSLEIVGGTDFEIKAHTHAEKDCCVCVTRKTTVPNTYEDCEDNAPCDCRHE